jgi:hypothetical protein
MEELKKQGVVLQESAVPLARSDPEMAGNGKEEQQPFFFTDIAMVREYMCITDCSPWGDPPDSVGQADIFQRPFSGILSPSQPPRLRHAVAEALLQALHWETIYLV